MMSRDIALLPLLGCTAGLGSPKIRTSGFCTGLRAGANPHLLLQVEVQERVIVFRQFRFEKLKRVRVTWSIPSLGCPHLYEGVPLLPQGIIDTASAVIEVSLDSHHSVTIPSVDLDANIELIVVDSVDGKRSLEVSPTTFSRKSKKRMRHTVQMHRDHFHPFH